MDRCKEERVGPEGRWREWLDQLVDKINELAASSKFWRNSKNVAQDGVRVALVGKGRSVLGNAFYVATTAPTGWGV
jgi:hypothetical protein